MDELYLTIGSCLRCRHDIEQHDDMGCVEFHEDLSWCECNRTYDQLTSTEAAA